MPSKNQPAENSFTFLRLMLALLVVYGHSYVLGGFGEEPLGLFSRGSATGRDMAVKGFFIISGYLLTHSLLRNPSLGRYALRRLFRILPAYWLTLLVTTFVVAPILFASLYPGKLTYAQSLTHGNESALGYLWRNSLLWQAQLKIEPLLIGNHLSGIVNGSLWSLFYEALCYLGLAAAAWAGLLKRCFPAIILFGILYSASVVAMNVRIPLFPKEYVLSEIGNLALHPAGPCVVLAFTAGVVTRLLSNGARIWRTRWVLIASFFFIFACWFGAIRVIWPLALPYLLIALAERLPFRKLDRLGDFSYGIYIYSFLIQQCLFAFGWQHRGFTAYLLLSLGLSLAAGVCSWFLVEKSAIALGQRIIERFSRAALSTPSQDYQALPVMASALATPEPRLLHPMELAAGQPQLADDHRKDF